jgi:hypothetical protein
MYFSSRRSNGSIIGTRCPADGERMSCGGFSLDETIHFGSLDFITDRFGSLSLSLMGDGSDAIIMGPARGGPPSLL